MYPIEKDKIHIIGAAILDVLVTPAEPEVFDTGSYSADNIQIHFGGDALNEAIVLSALGKKVTLNTIVGRDPEGDLICQHCEKMGILLTDNCRRLNLQTGVNVVLVQKNGERNFLTNRNGSLRKLTIEDIAVPFPDDVKILCFASIFVFPQIGGGELAEIFEQAKKQGILVCADMTKRKKNETVADLAPALQYVDYLLPNEEEAYLVTGAETVEAAAAVLLQAGAKNVIVKCGSKGCYVLNGESGFYVPAVEGTVCVDTTGAGDSFAAGFICGLSEGWDLYRCAEFANRCGAQAVSRIGATSWCAEGVSDPGKIPL